MNIVGIIPARMSSSRFPGKPLAKICGIPMIGHVYFRSKICKKLDKLYVATCDKEIADYITSIGGEVIMTANTHERASERTAEALLKIEKKADKKFDIVVMIQGDEPMVFPQMIEESIDPLLRDNAAQVVNLVKDLRSKQDKDDPNQVKVVFDKDNYALYFSREPIPSQKKINKDVIMYRQVPIISFKRDFLLIFNKLKPTPLEIIESVDMLRIIEHGYEVKVALTEFEIYSVDTPRDLIRVQRLMKKDKLYKVLNP